MAKKTATTLEDYISGLDSWQQEIARTFAALVAKSAPQSTSYIKWGHPVWDHMGPFALLKPAKGHVTLGFWRGAQLDDPDALLDGGGAGMRYLRIKAGERLAPNLGQMVRQAVTLNKKLGNPA